MLAILAVVASMTCVVQENGRSIQHDLTFYSPAPHQVHVVDRIDRSAYRTTYKVVSSNRGGVLAVRSYDDGGFSMITVDRNRAFGQTTGSNGRTLTSSGECRVKKAAR